MGRGAGCPVAGWGIQARALTRRAPRRREVLAFAGVPVAVCAQAFAGGVEFVLAHAQGGGDGVAVAPVAGREFDQGLQQPEGGVAERGVVDEVFGGLEERGARERANLAGHRQWALSTRRCRPLAGVRAPC
ncbi:hypothetical protein E4198_06315 [Streptomyces sp. RKND-216]|nr:hypothetical protein E4198_06315 [Streptomyces sp. RKND-216]